MNAAAGTDLGEGPIHRWGDGHGKWLRFFWDFSDLVTALTSDDTADPKGKIETTRAAIRPFVQCLIYFGIVYGGTWLWYGWLVPEAHTANPMASGLYRWVAHRPPITTVIVMALMLPFARTALLSIETGWWSRLAGSLASAIGFCWWWSLVAVVICHPLAFVLVSLVYRYTGNDDYALVLQLVLGLTACFSLIHVWTKRKLRITTKIIASVALVVFLWLWMLLTLL